MKKIKLSSMLVFSLLFISFSFLSIAGEKINNKKNIKKETIIKYSWGKVAKYSIENRKILLNDMITNEKLYNNKIGKILKPKYWCSLHSFEYTPELCIGCGACVDECPYEAITLNAEYSVVIINCNICTDCGACVEYEICGAECLVPVKGEGSDDPEEPEE
jgi:ferredoxin